MSDISDNGYLRIGKEEDRVMIASILYKNGYSVSPVRMKKTEGHLNILYSIKE